MHVALTGLLEDRPDLVVSGINQGQNMGEDVLYSGTVAAAIEGYLFGIPSIAFSQVDKGWSISTPPRAWRARSWNASSPRLPAQEPFLLNVNIPNSAVRASARAARDAPRQAGSVAARHHAGESARRYQLLDRPGRRRADASEGTDFHATANGLCLARRRCSSTSPIARQLEQLGQWLER